MERARSVGKVAVFIAVLAVTGPLLRAAGSSGLLEWAALPAALAIIGIFRTLGPRAEHTSWAVFLALLGAVYLDPSVAAPHTARELVALALCVALAIGGVVASPWLLALGFVGHVAWDFLPRALIPPFEGLPLACLLFDGLVAAYIGLQVRSGRWRSLRERRTPTGRLTAESSGTDS